MKSELNIKNISASIIMIFLFLITGMNSCTVKTAANESVKDVMDRTVTRLYHTMSEQQLDSLTNDQALALFNKKDKEVLATRYWMFDVNVPVPVSVLPLKSNHPLLIDAPVRLLILALNVSPLFVLLSFVMPFGPLAAGISSIDVV